MAKTWNIEVPGTNKATPAKGSARLKMSQAILDNMDKIQSKINEFNSDEIPKVPITICYDGQAMFCLNSTNPLFFFDGVSHIKVEKSDLLFRSDYLTDGYNLMYIEDYDGEYKYVVHDIVEDSATAGDMNIRDMDMIVHKFLCARYMPFDAVSVEHES